MPVDPQIQRLLEARAKLPAIHTLSIADARTLMAAREVPGLRKPALADVREQVIDGPGGALRLRIYTPARTGSVSAHGVFSRRRLRLVQS